MLPAPWLIGLAFVVGLLVLIPARRLQLADIPPRVIGLYALGLWILAMVLAIRPAGARILIPFLLVAYLAPFVAAPDAVRRLVTRGRGGDGRSDGTGVGRPPMKDVTPPGEHDEP